MLKYKNYHIVLASNYITFGPKPNAMTIDIIKFKKENNLKIYKSPKEFFLTSSLGITETTIELSPRWYNPYCGLHIIYSELKLQPFRLTRKNVLEKKQQVMFNDYNELFTSDFVSALPFENDVFKKIELKSLKENKMLVYNSEMKLIGSIRHTKNILSDYLEIIKNTYQEKSLLKYEFFI